MHEASLATSVFEILNEAQLENKKVIKIILNVGKPHIVVFESFEFYFSELAKGTIYENAELIFKETDTRGFFIESVEVEDGD